MANGHSFAPQIEEFSIKQKGAAEKRAPLKSFLNKLFLRDHTRGLSSGPR